jgi:nitrite reductase (NADH) small subunit
MISVQDASDSKAYLPHGVPAPAEPVWHDVCSLGELPAGLGAAALIDGQQIAIVRSHDGRVWALSNFDPFSRAFVIARGIVGDRNGTPKIASPMYKQSFALETGQCLDDPDVRLPVFATRVVAERVQVALHAALSSEAGLLP